MVLGPSAVETAMVWRAVRAAGVGVVVAIAVSAVLIGVAEIATVGSWMFDPELFFLVGAIAGLVAFALAFVAFFNEPMFGGK